MSNPSPEPTHIDEVNPAELLEAIAEGARRALHMHKRAGNPVAVWRAGKLVLVPPEEIPEYEV